MQLAGGLSLMPGGLRRARSHGGLSSPSAASSPLSPPADGSRHVRPIKEGDGSDLKRALTPVIARIRTGSTGARDDHGPRVGIEAHAADTREECDAPCDMTRSDATSVNRSGHRKVGESGSVRGPAVIAGHARAFSERLAIRRKQDDVEILQRHGRPFEVRRRDYDALCRRGEYRLRRHTDGYE